MLEAQRAAFGGLLEQVEARVEGRQARLDLGQLGRRHVHRDELARAGQGSHACQAGGVVDPPVGHQRDVDLRGLEVVGVELGALALGVADVQLAHAADGQEVPEVLDGGGARAARVRQAHELEAERALLDPCAGFWQAREQALLRHLLAEHARQGRDDLGRGHEARLGVRGQERRRGLRLEVVAVHVAREREVDRAVTLGPGHELLEHSSGTAA